MRVNFLIVLEFDDIGAAADDEEVAVGAFNYSSVAGADEARA